MSRPAYSVGACYPTTGQGDRARPDSRRAAARFGESAFTRMVEEREGRKRRERERESGRGEERRSEGRESDKSRIDGTAALLHPSVPKQDRRNGSPPAR